MKETGARNGWRLKLHEVIFEADTPAGKWFDDYRLWFHRSSDGNCNGGIGASV